jgi:hypothetical protein
VVVIGGDASSLVLTLFLVPIMYVIMAPKHVEVTQADPDSELHAPNGHGGVHAAVPAGAH